MDIKMEMIIRKMKKGDAALFPDGQWVA